MDTRESSEVTCVANGVTGAAGVGAGDSVLKSGPQAMQVAQLICSAMPDIHGVTDTI